MIVIGIIAIINLVMVPSFTSLQRSAKQLSAKSSARQLMVGLEQYQFMHQVYPEGTNVPMATIAELLIDEQIIQALPTNPYTGQVYGVQDSSGQIMYTKQSSGEYQIIGYGDANDAIIFSFP
jgi:type II secretory pathway pseudopilin PulG